MKIIQPYARMLTNDIDLEPEISFQEKEGIYLLRKCEYAARVSHRSEDKITETSYDKFLRFVVMEKGDLSVIQHAHVTVEAVVDRGITHEWVRHRIGAYTQESTRFVNYKNRKIEFIDPFSAPGVKVSIPMKVSWENSIDKAEYEYLQLVNSEGGSPQIARSVLPNALASKLIVTYNLSIWRYFFLMRTTKEAHPQMKQVTIPLLKEFQEKIPILYEDIIPETKQSENLKKLH